MNEPALAPADLEQLAERGIGEHEAQQQLALLREELPPPALLRPATLGDGIERLDESEGADLDAFERARRGTAIERFVPASGAASRMFADLVAAVDGAVSGGDDALARFERELARLPFQRDIAATRARLGTARGSTRETLVRALLYEQPAALLERPKGLLSFHRYDTEELTAFEEHLHEWGALCGGAPARLHATISPPHRAGFVEILARARSAMRAATGTSLEGSFSEQDPSTDTIALAEDGDLARDARGRPLLRPGGHGALLSNLASRARAGIELLHLRNIDNVARAEDHPRRVAVCRRLLGRLARLREEVFALLRDLDGGGDAAIAAAERFVVERLRREAPRGGASERRAALRHALDRPLRVCGMVPNEGEPGGGPFWAEDPEGRVTLQIVEASQVPRDDAEQVAILRAATHFNPVDLACCVRDFRGRPFELERFVDERTWFRASKTQDGRAIRVLERPGLWNGSMAGWITAFLEIPAAVFSPVKTVWDLLRPAHLGRSGDTTP